MSQVFTASTEVIMAGLFPPRYDQHMIAWRWHAQMSNVNPGYQEEIARRQAAKRAAGIGPEGRCPA